MKPTYRENNLLDYLFMSTLKNHKTPSSQLLVMLSKLHKLQNKLVFPGSNNLKRCLLKRKVLVRVRNNLKQRGFRSGKLSH